MKTDRFCTIDAAAENINVLIAYLREQDNDQYLYRGQTKIYDGPLLSSAYRGLLNLDERHSSGNLASAEQLRGVGRNFVGNARPDYAQLAPSLPQEKQTAIRERAIVRQQFLDAFGYLLGSTITQHYGFKSEFLDATTNVDVAAFFATHDSPHYESVARSPRGNSLSETANYGMIYRFERLDPDIRKAELLSYNYFNAPGTLVCTDLLKHFEDDVTLKESWTSIRYYHELFRFGGDRYIGILKLPRGLVDNSRIGRQFAAVIIPDELRIYSPDPVTSLDPHGLLRLHVGERRILLQSIEDLSMRDGTRAFYFKHSDHLPPSTMTANNLWPNVHDSLLQTIVYILSETYSGFTNISWGVEDQLKLIDPGCSNIEFGRILEQIQTFAKSCDNQANTLKFSGLLPDRGVQLKYFARKAAALCHRGHVTGQENHLREAMWMLDKAIEIDSKSIVLYVLKNILHESVGEMGDAQFVLWIAFDIAQEPPGTGVVMHILGVLNQAIWQHDFVDVFWEYYQSF